MRFWQRKKNEIKQSNKPKNISVEISKPLGVYRIEKIATSLDEIYDTGKIP